MKFEDGYIQYEVGDFVYRAFKPQTPGKVVAVIDGGTKSNPATGKTWKVPNRAEVKWLNGKVEMVDMLVLQSFYKLIADHEKKLETHKSKLLKLLEL